MRLKTLSDTTSAKTVQDSAGQESPSFSVVNPVLGRNFEGNGFDGTRPPDNAMAISDDGWIVSVVNSNISFVDENGVESLSSVSLDEYFDFLNLSSNYFDPKVIYDPVGDRFILVVLNGSTSAESKLVVAFSQSQDPNDGWWVYTFDGDFANANTWFDYPQIGLSTEDLYVCGNLFDDNDLFNQAVIIQFNKEQGYVGGSLGYSYWSNVTNVFGQKVFSIQPVTGGYGSYGPGLYLISSYFSSGISLSLFDVTADYGNSPVLQKYEVNCSSYNIGSDAEQPGTSKLLSVNDCRIQSAFYNFPTIYYVHHHEYQNSGYNGIRYGRLNVSNQTVSSFNFGFNGATNSYPVLAPFSTTPGSSDVLIGYTRSSSSTFPQLRAVTHDGTTTSTSITLKSGNSSITPSNDDVERWGDYLGISRRYNASSPAVWVYGNFGNNNTYGNWIAEVVPEGTVIPGTSCSQAIPISCGASINGTTQGLSQNVPDCGYAFNTAPGLWYKFTGTGDNVNLTTCSYANYDTKIAVYEGSCSNLLCVAGNDDDLSCGNKSSVGFTSISGTTYYVYVTGYSSNSGSFTLDVQCGCVSSPYAPDDPTYLQVIAQDPTCCFSEWDADCENLYNQLSSACSGNTDLYECMGSFDDGSISGIYTNNLDCSWTISPPGAASITLNFTNFDTESCCDSVIVYDGTDEGAPVLGKFSGIDLPPSLTAYSGSMFVRFESDFSFAGDGWSAEYFCCNTLAPPVVTTSTGSTVICNGQNVILNATNICSNCTITWSNGQSGPSTTVNSAGSYSAVLMDMCGQTISSNTITLTQGSLPSAPTITAGGPTVLCSGETVTLTATGTCPGCTINWSTGQTGPSITVNAVGNYSARFVNGCGPGPFSGNIAVTAGAVPTSIPTVVANGPTVLCPGDMVTLTAGGSCMGCSVEWSDGQTGTTISVNTTGSYAARFSNGCGDGSYSANIAVTAGTLPTTAPAVSPNGPTALCQGQSVTLTANGTCSGCTVEWSTGAIGTSINVNTAGSYVAFFTNNCGDGPFSNTVNVTTNGMFTPVFQVNNICNLAAPTGSNYQWFLEGVAIPGATGQFWQVQTSGYYTLSMVDNSGCNGVSEPVYVLKCTTSSMETLDGIQAILYPNPTNNKVFLVLASQTGSLVDVQLELFDIDGRYLSRLFQKDVLNGGDVQEIPLPNLSSGVYIYKLSSKNGSVNGKLIVE